MVTVTSNASSIVDHDGAVILDIPRNSMTTLDATGAYVWERLQSGLEIDAIVAELARDTGVDELLIRKDLEAFMEQLKVRHLVTTSSSGELPKEQRHG